MNRDPRLIDAPAERPRWSQWDDRVQKIVLGSLGRESGEGIEPVDWDESSVRFAQRFPNLTHLYIWNVPEIEELPVLPHGLRVLDVRGCASLKWSPPLPSSLRTLILDGSPELEELCIDSLQSSETGLEELSLQGNAKLGERGLLAVLRGAPRLEIADLSGCVKLESVTEWSQELLDLRLNGCEHLGALPEWPPKLRRLELRGVPVEELDWLPSSIDFIDLGGMRRLKKLPDNWSGARTLFLHGSGCIAPPASEHGAAADENVAERTRRYFKDIELVGPGSVKRCKLLMLGNGGAGKTCLSLNLAGGNPQRTRPNHRPAAERIGTTHGVQFHRWEVQGTVGSRNQKVAVHVWDFGGQEIYHNTHRLFLGSGTVFVVVWDPDAGPAREEEPRPGYVDTPRSLGYWLDFIQQATGPVAAEVVVVCSKRHASDPDLLLRMEKEAGADRLKGLGVFFVDSIEGTGQLEALREKLTSSILSVVTAQGTVVPAHWEVAQDMVEGWVEALEKRDPAAQARRQMAFEEFRQELESECRRRNVEPRLSQLGKALKGGSFQLDGERVERTLSFLTHSGWVFWDPELFDRRVIVGQKWALEGLYTLLERVQGEKPSPVYDALLRRSGRFTIEDLERWGWAKTVPSPEERELLISFMQRIGLCFTLVNRDESLWGRAIYVSLAHLPQRKELSGANWNEKGTGKGRSKAESRSFEHPRLHRGHWERILRSLGSRFGTDGDYARDGFLGRTRKGQRICIEFDLSEAGFGGTIHVRVGGPEASDLASELIQAVEGSVQSELERRRPGEPVADAAGEAEGAVSVFLSYAWAPPKVQGNHWEEAVSPDYEGPVDAIQKALEAAGKRVNLMRDRFCIAPGGSIAEFIAQVKVTDRVVVVHSDRYWKSQFCMYELASFCNSLIERTVEISKTLTLVSHLHTAFERDGQRCSGPLRDGNALDCLRKHWTTIPDGGLFPMLEELAKSMPKLRSAVMNVLDNILPRLSSLRDWELSWDERNPSAVVNEVVKRVLRT